MSLLATLGLKSDLRYAPRTDLAPSIKRAVARIGAAKDPAKKAAAIAELKQIDADRIEALTMDQPLRDKKLGILSTRIEILIDGLVKPVRHVEKPDIRNVVRYRIEDRYTGRVSEVTIPDGDRPDVFELDGMPRGRFAFRIDRDDDAAQPEPAPEPTPEVAQPLPPTQVEPPKQVEPKPTPKPHPKPKPKPQPKPPVIPVPPPTRPVPPEAVQPPVVPEPPKVDDEERQKRREQARRDIAEAEKHWAKEDPLIIEYLKKDFIDVTLTEGMDNVSAFTGWMETGAKMVPGGQGLAAAMEVVGLTADVANTTYVVVKSLAFDPANKAAGTVTEKAAGKIGKAAVDKAKKTVVKKLHAKYPMVPEPLLEKVVGEAVDRVVDQFASGAGETVTEAIGDPAAPPKG